MPTGIGMGSTWTLAKLANHIVKTAERKPGSYPADLAQVCNLAALPASDLDALLAATAVGDICAWAGASAPSWWKAAS